VAVSKSEQLPEDGQVRPKHVAVDCDCNVTLNEGEIVNRVALKTEVNV
jgi:3-phosphoglycerate kinase